MGAAARGALAAKWLAEAARSEGSTRQRRRRCAARRVCHRPATRQDARPTAVRWAAAAWRLGKREIATL
eukprot:1452229-Pleurochrysis_carterae.AAC.1